MHGGQQWFLKVREALTGARGDAPVSRCQHVAVSATSTLQLFGALAVVATALLDPFQAAVGVGGLVRVVLLEAGVHARPSRRLVRIFRRDRRWKDGISGGPLRSCGTPGCWSGGRGRGGRPPPPPRASGNAPSFGGGRGRRRWPVGFW